MESISKNLWLLLTLVIPGLFTYGLWRLSLFFITELPKSLTPEKLEQIDASNMTTTCIIFSFALMQQAVAVMIEAIIYYFMNKSQENNHENKDNKKSILNTLFCERFVLASKGHLNEQAERIIGNFFLSMNITIGICLLIAYFAGYIGFEKSQSVIIGLIVLLPAAITTTYFRMVTAGQIINECKKNPPITKETGKTD